MDDDGDSNNDVDDTNEDFGSDVKAKPNANNERSNVSGEDGDDSYRIEDIKMDENDTEKKTLRGNEKQRIFDGGSNMEVDDDCTEVDGSALVAAAEDGEEEYIEVEKLCDVTTAISDPVGDQSAVNEHVDEAA